jgi:hypothetical protein
MFIFRFLCLFIFYQHKQLPMVEQFFKGYASQEVTRPREIATDSTFLTGLFPRWYSGPYRTYQTPRKFSPPGYEDPLKTVTWHHPDVHLFHLLPGLHCRHTLPQALGRVPRPQLQVLLHHFGHAGGVKRSSRHRASEGLRPGNGTESQF